MRISATTAYREHRTSDCFDLEDCDRLYCMIHRLLFRACETAVYGWEGDADVVNGERQVVEVGRDCPRCLRELRNKREAQEIASCVDCKEPK